MTKKIMVFSAALLLVASLISGCNKSDTQYPDCYECQTISGSTDYQSVGCYSTEAWLHVTINDNNGVAIDKAAKCRKK